MIILPAGESNESGIVMPADAYNLSIFLAFCLCSVLGCDGMVCDYWLFRSVLSAALVVRCILTISCAVAVTSNYSVAFGVAPYYLSSLDASLVGHLLNDLVYYNGVLIPSQLWVGAIVGAILGIPVYCFLSKSNAAC